jgi:hypothetical protein
MVELMTEASIFDLAPNISKAFAAFSKMEAIEMNFVARTMYRREMVEHTR